MTDIKVAVRDLVAFCHRQGDLDHRFTAAPTGAEGVQGHQYLYRRRPASYQPEYAVEHRYEAAGVSVLLRGRADGYDAAEGLVEEIKTCRGSFERIPEAVSEMHWAQARLYGAMIAEAEGCAELTLRLTWFNVDSHAEQQDERRYTAPELAAFLEQTLARFADWMAGLAALRLERDRSLSSLDFPHGEFRPGQRDMSELVYKCIDQGGQLMLEAPTGIGKTAAVLFPALKALAAGKHERLVFTTARNVGRRAAEDTLALFAEQGYRGSSLSLTSKERICFSPGRACHAEDCPYAEGYYDKLPAAMEDAIAEPALSRERVESIAREHALCPYQLGLDLLPWVDVIIADLHYAFSLSPTLGHRSSSDSQRWSVVVDEAHNLPGRARGMFSARLGKRALMAARKVAPKAIRRTLDRVNRILLALQKEAWQQADFDTRTTMPADLLAALERFTGEVAAALAEEPTLVHRHPDLADFFFDVLQFQRVAEQWGEEFRFELARGFGKQGLEIALNCLEPSRLLGQRHGAFHASTAFSATLSPAHWTLRALGLDEGAVYRRLASPFSREQLSVELDTSVDTRYRQREQSMPRLASSLEEWAAADSGNCIYYFPSYRYLRDCLESIDSRGRWPAGRRRWEQRPEMADEERDELFSLLESERNVDAFCILGGVFGEGIDLPGERLSAVVVVGVGLPQVNRDNEQLRDYYQETCGNGFATAYLYPGMQKVDQAIGRVIRRSGDSGRALLLDRRYGSTEYRELLPPWWDYRLRP